MACTCADQCPHSKHCIALGIPDAGKCWVLCDEDAHDEGTAPPIELDTRIDLDTRGVDRLQLAEFLGRRSPAELLVRVSGARDGVELSVHDAAFGDVLEQAGIVVADGPAAS